MITGNKFFWLANLQDAQKWWPFLFEGLNSLNDPHGARGDMEPLQFFQMVLHAISCHPTNGGVGVLTSKNDKPLGYGIILNNTEPYCRKSAVVYAVYSNGKCPTTTVELLTNAESWARSQGYCDLQACSRRINGAAIRLFEKKWGFRRACLVFRKELV